MKQADPMGSPQERLVHYLEMATKAHEAARNPTADVQVRNLYSWLAKSWELLAVDELERLRSISHAEGKRTRGTGHSRARAGQSSHVR
jgi:hypothetical protein